MYATETIDEVTTTRRTRLTQEARILSVPLTAGSINSACKTWYTILLVLVLKFETRLILLSVNNPVPKSLTCQAEPSLHLTS